MPRIVAHLVALIKVSLLASIWKLGWTSDGGSTDASILDAGALSDTKLET